MLLCMSPVPDLKFKVVSELLPGLCGQVLQVCQLCLEFFGLDMSANISVDLFQGCLPSKCSHSVLNFYLEHSFHIPHSLF